MIARWLGLMLAGCTLGAAEPGDTDDVATVPVNMFVIDRENQCVRYVAVPMPAEWWTGWPAEHDCVDSLDPFAGEVWTGQCAFMPNLCYSNLLRDEGDVFFPGSGYARGCWKSGNDPCDCTYPYSMTICGSDQILMGSDCLNRDWPTSDCGFTAEPL